VHVFVDCVSLAGGSCDLFSENNGRSTLSDEAKEVGPQMPWIVGTEPASCRTERLARAGARPERAFVGPSSKSSCDGPQPAASEEVALRVTFDVIRVNLFDRPGIDVARRDNAFCYQVSQDMRSGGINLVVVGTHCATLRP
jgi:hypothetical protein